MGAYLAGMKIENMEHRFGVGRSTIYHVLRRSNVLPSRSRRRVEGASKDAAIAGLYELIKHQDRVIAERDAQLVELTSEVAALKRRLRRLTGGDGHAPAKRVASKRRAAG